MSTSGEHAVNHTLSVQHNKRRTREPFFDTLIKCAMVVPEVLTAGNQQNVAKQAVFRAFCPLDDDPEVAKTIGGQLAVTFPARDDEPCVERQRSRIPDTRTCHCGCDVPRESHTGQLSADRHVGEAPTAKGDTFPYFTSTSPPACSLSAGSLTATSMIRKRERRHWGVGYDGQT